MNYIMNQPVALPGRAWGFFHPDLEGLVRVVVNLTYKPGWYFTLEGRGETAVLEITVDVIDAYSGQPNRVYVSENIDRQHAFVHGFNLWPEWVRRLIKRTELHEMDEHIVIGSQRPFDPHRDRAAPRPDLVVPPLSPLAVSAERPPLPPLRPNLYW